MATSSEPKSESSNKVAPEHRLLPRYFPTYHPQCKSAAEAFFACFETHSEMKHAKDTTSAREGITKCVPELDAYEACQDVAIQKAAQQAKRSWWKFW